MPTYIYPNTEDFSAYAMNQYYQMNNIPMPNKTSEQCTLFDPQCENINTPPSDRMNDTDNTCLTNPFFAARCCSLQAEAFFVNSSRASKSDWRDLLSDFIDGGVSLNINHRITVHQIDSVP